MALFISVLATCGTPDWSRVVLPAGRSKAACYQAYNQAIKDAAVVPMAGSVVIKKRKRATPSPSKAKDNEDADALVPPKKIKKDAVIETLKIEKDELLNSDHEDEDVDDVMVFEIKKERTD